MTSEDDDTGVGSAMWRSALGRCGDRPWEDDLAAMEYVESSVRHWIAAGRDCRQQRATERQRPAELDRQGSGEQGDGDA